VVLCGMEAGNCGTEAGDWYCVLWRLMTVVLHGMEAREFGALWYGGW